MDNKHLISDPADHMITDGLYFLAPEGCCWIAARISDGRLVDSTTEADYGTHKAAGDAWAGVAPEESDELVDADGAAAIVAIVLPPDSDPELVGVYVRAGE